MPGEVYILCFTANSGLTHYSISLARELSERGAVSLITARGYSAQGYGSYKFKVMEFFRRSRWYPFDLIKLFLLLWRTRPELVLFESVLKVTLVEALLVRVLRRLGIRTAMTIHDLLPHYPKPWSRWTHRTLYRSFDQLIVHSERASHGLCALGIRTPVLVVPHGTYDIFAEGARTRTPRRELTGFDERDFVCLFFGTIDVRKGISSFLLARAEFASEEGYRFLIAGRPGILSGDADAARLLDAARGSPDCRVFDGGIPFSEVADYFRSADLVVLPYQEGTTSGVLKLALAFGKPVVATDVGDLADVAREDMGVLLPARCSSRELA